MGGSSTNPQIGDVRVTITKTEPCDISILANIVGAGVGLIVAVAGIAWSVLVIAIAWLAYRPVIAIALLVVSGALIFYLIKHGKEKKAALAAV